IIPNLDRKLYGEFCRFNDRVIGTDNYAVEVPNSTRRTVPFREIMEQLSTKSPLMIPFGINIKNRLVQGDLRKFPHMLVCGATGSGKSIFMHSIICALLMRNSPDTLRLILIDPKGTETTMYRKDPHLACPLISDVAQAGAALGRLVDEMEERNKIFQEAEVRDVESYNGYYCKEHGLPPMPYLICIVDEFADLVETQKEKVTSPVLRLASKARSAGIHLIIATQRPDSKVINGTIKANFTTRVALKVQSVVDSMTILGQGGAETLLKYGDMLISSGEVSAQGFTRAQGCLIEVSEIHRIVNDAASKRPQQFFDRFLNLEEEEETPDTPLAEETPPSMNVNRMTEESIYLRVREYVMARDSTSISQITQAFNVGYPRGSKLFRRLQQEGIIGPSQGNSAKGCPVLRHNLDETPAPKDRLTLPGDNE
ncbi:MAG: FtsK/SpoIIIE domain-containing protein, partial [Candidatus Enteromonas sp.]|nr:FtsK/SpoIIIE domain-containing protein [Candidatus Enteromonas sp.]